jgi:hypothetical protein
MMNRGILFLAKGSDFIADAHQSAQRIRSVMPDTPISIFTNEEIDAPYFDNIIIDDSEFTLCDKPIALEQSPYDKTIYIDTDTYLKEDISEIFDILDAFEMALVRDHIEYNTRKFSEPHPIDGVPEGFPEFNGGFIAFRKTSAVIDFFRDWQNRIQPEHDQDQRTLLTTSYNSPARSTRSPPRYNCLYTLNGCVTGTVKVFHAASGDLEKNIDLSKAIQKFSRSNHPRLYQTYEETVFVDLPPPFYLKLLVTLRDKGITTVAKKIVNRVVPV